MMVSTSNKTFNGSSEKTDIISLEVTSDVSHNGLVSFPLGIAMSSFVKKNFLGGSSDARFASKYDKMWAMIVGTFKGCVHPLDVATT